MSEDKELERLFNERLDNLGRMINMPLSKLKLLKEEAYSTKSTACDNGGKFMNRMEITRG